MKTIVRNDNKVSLYAFPDETPINVLDDRIDVGTPIFLIIADCNSDNVTVYDGVEPPSDWMACKYTFNGTDWDLNPDWTDVQKPEFEAEPS